METRSFNPMAELRLRRLVERVHALGAPAFLYLLREIAADDELTRVLERYARLPADFIQMSRADHFPEPMMVFNGGRH